MFTVYSLLKSIAEYISGVATIVPSPTASGKPSNASESLDVVSVLVDEVVLDVELDVSLDDVELLLVPPQAVNKDAVIHILRTVAKNFFFFIRPLLYI
jgi:hypothetical protein